MVNNSPLFYYTLFYITGIYIGDSFNCWPEPFIALTFTILTISIFIFRSAYVKIYSNSNVNSLLHYFIFLTFLLSGISNIALSPYANKNLISSLAQKEEVKKLKLIIIKRAERGKNSSRIECHTKEYNENIILYSRHIGVFDKVCLGDTITIDYRPIEITNISSHFDYKKHQARRRCFTYGYLKNSNLKIVKPKNKPIILKIRIEREKLIERVREKYNESEWCDILIALVSGEKNYLEDQTKEIFKASGAMHLMAVSGLHVGFVYFFVLNALLFLGKRGIVKYVKALVLILAIWFYCAFTGFSPSSVRASLMISILVISELHTGRYVLLNALCASALIITLIQPQSLFNIGFQLSYMALLSIVVINPFFNRERVSKSRVIQYCWNIITISISCQIGTSFITIGSFGYFPLYFMISNLILMPLTAVVLYCFGAILLLGSWDGAVGWLFKVIKVIIDVMYKTALKIDSLPFSIIETNKSSVAKILAYSIAIIITATIVWSFRKRGLQSRGYE